MTPVIETHDLKKSFKAQGKLVEAVKGVNLRVEAGQIFGFLGPNGAGKSTTMRMLTTLLIPDSGTASIVGYDLQKQAAQIRASVGFVSQNGGASGNSTGYENMLLQGQLYGMSKADAKQRADEVAKALELDSFAARLVKTYSGGQRRRLDLALGMIHRPRLLFLDEPTTGLDPQSRARLWDEIRRLRSEGTTVFLTTHYMDEADVLCDYLSVMDNGEIMAEGDPQALKRRISGDIVRLGIGEREAATAILCAQPYVVSAGNTDEGLLLYVNDGDRVLPDMLRVLDSAGIPVHSLSMARLTLDDVFLQLTGRSLREAAN